MGWLCVVKEHGSCQRRFFLPRFWGNRCSVPTMRRVNLVKTCSIIGFVLAEIYMLFVVLAPNLPGKTSRMLIPEVLIPKEPGVEPGAKAPVGAQVKRILIAGVFFGPFGAMAGLGVGLLLEGGRQFLGRFRQSSSGKEELPKPPSGE
jgi:hypothetical protein